MSDSSNYDEESNDEGKVAVVKNRAAAMMIPYRMQQVLISWVFLIASMTLILDFASLQDLMRNITRHTVVNRFDELCNWFGVVSCISWLFGFIVLGHWLKSVGATQLSLLGCWMKIVASILFNLQPMTGTMNDAVLGGSAGLWWSNLAGILFFHVGNLISCFDMYVAPPPGANKRRGWCYHGNLPITGMWTYQAATWFLVAANFMSCSFGGQYDWAPIRPIRSMPVFACQFVGSTLLLLGSVFYTIWCDGFSNFSNPPLGSS